MTARSISGVALRSIDVMLVDDDADTREMMRTVFEMEKWVTRDFGDVASALASAVERAPHVVITDLQVETPLDGFRFAQALRADPRTRRAKLLLITGRDVGPSVTYAFDAHLRKPASIGRLLEVIESLAAARSAKSVLG